MNPALIVRFRPAGPWRIGTDSGGRDRVDRIFHSDTLFSAVAGAMLELGKLEAWLAATVAGPQPQVRLSSCFPFLEEVHFVAPPRNLWPPPPSPKVRWRNARFVPLAVVKELVAEQPLRDSAWYVDGASECLLPADAGFHSGPFRIAVRSHAAVDRLQCGSVEVHRTACLEFAAGGGMWAIAGFADEAAEAQWSQPLCGALRLLADTGFGGERSLGWGRSETPEFIEGFLPDLILPAPAAAAPEPPPVEGEAPAETPPRPPVENGWWLLSLFSPAPQDTVDWHRGCYSLVSRGGIVERSGQPKKLLRMVEEGSVLAAEAPPVGAAPDVAPEAFSHPVYRSGFALALPVPLRPAERPLGAS